MTSTAIVPTSKPIAYLRQLCKHFAHKVRTEYDDHTGQINFPFGVCDLVASADRLNLQVTAGSDVDLTRMEDVVGSHLERFGSRDELAVAWTRIP